MKRLVYILICVVMFAACGDNKPEKPKINTNNYNNQNTTLSPAPVFNPDSAYSYIEQQLSFGPRVPNSKGHKQCGDYLIATLERFGAEVVVQNANVTAYTGANLKIRNIIARFAPEKANRVALFAHWDTRPFADRDSSTDNKPIPGADDGGSGVAVLLEIARLMQSTPPTVGVDIILFDGEDYGSADGEPDSYCLGSQYWGKNPPIPGYTARFGILLDMVGAQGAVFCKEGWSRQYAASIVQKVWNTAQQLGYGTHFFMKDTEPLTDDHYYVNTLAKIPTVDIINFDRDRGSPGFGKHWHTQQDDISIIDKNTLKAVGQTVLQVVYNEK